MPTPTGSNLHKVFWPEPGFTKGDLLAYLEAMAPVMVPALAGRPLTVKRYPDGIHGVQFFQKDTPANAPAWVKRVPLRAESAKRTVNYPVCDSKRTLLWLGNQAAIEFHPWLSRVDHLDRPDAMVFDFDPPEEQFERSVEAALAMREVLAEVGLEGATKTSGSKGVHVYVPLVRRHHYGQVRAAAVRLAAMLEARAGALTTTEFKKADRDGKVLIDIGRNAPGMHIAAPYSPRARDAGTVSFPVRWEDLERTRPEAFTLATAPKLVEQAGVDPWRMLLPKPQTLPRSLRD
jgi:bifunctional non-homologous end joining protein LigD